MASGTRPREVETLSRPLRRSLLQNVAELNRLEAESPVQRRELEAERQRFERGEATTEDYRNRHGRRKLAAIANLRKNGKY